MMKLKHNEAAIVFGAKGISLALPTGGKRGMVPSYCLSALALYHLLCSDEKLIERVIRWRDNDGESRRRGGTRGVRGATIAT